MFTDEEIERFAKMQAQALVDALPLVDKINEIMVTLTPSPAAAVYAALIMDRALGAQVTGWPQLKKLCVQSFEKLDRDGMLPDFKKMFIHKEGPKQ